MEGKQLSIISILSRGGDGKRDIKNLILPQQTRTTRVERKSQPAN